MQDLTSGSVHTHIARLSGFLLVAMALQTLYYLVDLYFVSGLGSAATAALGIAGNLMMVTVALTQALTVGTTSLVARAMGARQPDEARRLFGQSQVLATAAGLLFVGACFATRGLLAGALAGDAATAAELHAYLDWFIPALGGQFLMVSVGAALRGAGEVRLPMVVGAVSLAINMVLAPVLIAGWGTGRPLGVRGAGLATFVAVAVGALLLLLWLPRRFAILRPHRSELRPDLATWRAMLAIGMPAGGEFLLMTVYASLVFYVIRDLGSAEQAGFAVGMRVMQAGFIPGLAVAFSVAPIAGQAVGKGDPQRVRETLRAGVVWVLAIMLLFATLIHLAPEALVRPFAKTDPAVAAAAVLMLTILSYNFFANGVILVAGGIFQALGNTLPSLLASATRLVLFALPALVISRRPWFEVRHLWWLSVGSTLLQLCFSLWLLRGELRRRLPAIAAAAAAAVAPPGEPAPEAR